VDEEIVQTGGGDGIAERFQRHSPVTGRELEFFLVKVVTPDESTPITDARETAVHVVLRHR
jgi:hypothetical protein